MLIALITIIVLFFVLLLLKEFLPNKLKADFCALCGAVSLAWFVFLILYFAGLFHDKIILALLMGGSIVGLIYFISKKMSDEMKIFRLPFFVTLVSVAYFVVELVFNWKILILLILLWLVFVVFFLHKNNKFVEKIIACCRDW